MIAVVASRWWVKALGSPTRWRRSWSSTATANYYVLDVAGGLIALGLGFLTSVVITRQGPFSPGPEPSLPGSTLAPS